MITYEQAKELKQYDKGYEVDSLYKVCEIDFMGTVDSPYGDGGVMAIFYNRKEVRASCIRITKQGSYDNYFISKQDAITYALNLLKIRNNLKADDSKIGLCREDLEELIAMKKFNESERMKKLNESERMKMTNYQKSLEAQLAKLKGESE